jgi:NAD(P) transhydrogenase
MDDADFDILVLGAGPGGQQAALTAAELGRRAAVVERRDVVGRVCINTGTIPARALREAILHLPEPALGNAHDQRYRVKQGVTVQDLLTRAQDLIGREIEGVRSRLYRSGVSLLHGTARFVDPHTVSVSSGLTGERRYTAEHIVIATGTCPTHPGSVEFDECRVLDPDGVLALHDVPQSLVVVGAGMIGIEYASMFATLGSRVTVVEQRDRMLEFCDADVVEALRLHLRDLSVTFRFGEAAVAVQAGDKGTVTTLLGGKRIPADMVLYTAGRQGATEDLDLASAGLKADHRGRIEVDQDYRTAVPHLYAVGDVIDFPTLAATSVEQGRTAACHACQEPVGSPVALQPIGVHTIPEISYCGQTEEQLTASSVPHEVGISRFRDLARGQTLHDTHGMLKLLVSTESRRLLGVHVFGSLATELVHLGQAIMTCSGTADQLVDTVYNHPTLSEAYQLAALDALNKLRAMQPFVV